MQPAIGVLDDESAALKLTGQWVYTTEYSVEGSTIGYYYHASLSGQEAPLHVHAYVPTLNRELSACVPTW